MLTEAKELEAGAELDALVAEKVMGWRRVDSHDDPTLYIWRTLRGDVSPHYWKPSTDMTAAWQVVERIELLKYRTLEYIPRDGGWWIDDNHNHAVQVCAPTAPLAICRAALATVRAQS